MRAAPPVEIELGNGRREQAVLALIWAVAVLALVTWAQMRGWLPHLAMLAATGAVGGACVGWFVAPPMRGRLSWDGQTWSWRAPGFATRQSVSGMRVALDLGSWLLLRTDTGHWCAVSSGQAGAQWHGLQLALRNPVRLTQQESGS